MENIFEILVINWFVCVCQRERESVCVRERERESVCVSSHWFKVYLQQCCPLAKPETTCKLCDALGMT